MSSTLLDEIIEISDPSSSDKYSHIAKAPRIAKTTTDYVFFIRKLSTS